LPQAAHQQIDGAVEQLGLASLGEIQQLIAVEDAVRVV